MRLIAYSRVSTDDQASEGVSLAIQPQQLADFAAKNGHVIVRDIADHAVSGSVPLERRSGGAALMAALAAGEADGVVVVRLDRLFRDALDGLQFFAKAMRGPAAVQVLSISEAINTFTPMGRLMLTMALATAQYERDVAAQRAADNTRGMRESGRVYGTVPYGCIEVGQGDDGKRGWLVRNPVAWGIRERIVEMRASGETYDSIRAELARLHVQAPTGGKRWAKSTLRGIVESHNSLVHLPMQEGGALCP